MPRKPKKDPVLCTKCKVAARRIVNGGTGRWCADCHCRYMTAYRLTHGKGAERRAREKKYRQDMLAKGHIWYVHLKKWSNKPMREAAA